MLFASKSSLQASLGFTERGFENRSGPHHIQANVCQTTDKMMVRFHCGRMMAIFPESSLPLFPLVELLSCPACNQLHRPWDDLPFPTVQHEQMDVVRSARIVQYPQSAALPGFKKPHYPEPAVYRKFEEEFSLVAPVGNGQTYPGRKHLLALGMGDLPLIYNLRIQLGNCMVFRGSGTQRKFFGQNPIPTCSLHA